MDHEHRNGERRRLELAKFAWQIFWSIISLAIAAFVGYTANTRSDRADASSVDKRVSVQETKMSNVESRIDEVNQKLNRQDVKLDRLLELVLQQTAAAGR